MVPPFLYHSMKKLIIFILLIFSLSIYAQEKEVYALLGAFTKSSKKITSTVDFGDGTGELYICDEKGDKKIFKSLLEPANYMIERGWKIVNFNPVITPNNGFILYLMKKEIKDEKEKKKDLTLKE